jgi:hypothetical protein
MGGSWVNKLILGGRLVNCRIKYLFLFEWCNSTCRLLFNGKWPYPRYATGVLQSSPLSIETLEVSLCYLKMRQA